MPSLEEQLRRNALQLFEQLDHHCRAADRRREDVRLIAVTKYVDTPTARCLAKVLTQLQQQRGLPHPVALGENRPQALCQKIDQWEYGPPVEWHLIGHLQSNKIKRVAGRTALIHSLDRWDLLDKLETEAAASARPIAGLLEFRISDDESKHGFAAEQIEELLADLPRWPRLLFRGVMGMSGLQASSPQRAAHFRQLRDLFDRIGAGLPQPRREEWRELSMGMTADMPEAIAAGATMVRIGSALFAGLL